MKEVLLFHFMDQEPEASITCPKLHRARPKAQVSPTTVPFAGYPPWKTCPHHEGWHLKITHPDRCLKSHKEELFYF